MPKELTEQDLKNRRLKTCVQTFPNADTGEHNPRCCRFPKNCSPYASIEAYQAGNVSEADLEPPRKSVAEAMLETGLVTETKKLEPLRVGTSFVIDVKEMEELTPGNRQAAMDFELGRKRVELETFVLTEHLAEEEYVESGGYSFPETWWDMFKSTYQLTWWLGWFVDKFPAKYAVHKIAVGVKVDRYASYPEASIPIPDLGRPLPYERVRYLSRAEIEDIELQQDLEDQADNDRKLIPVYLLIEENFPDLMEETGLEREYFEELLAYDEEFDLNSKIYIIPAGVGYNK